MLEIQKYLKSGKTLDDLTTELAIRVTRHDTEPLAILNYDQIDSPKLHPLVREARGLVLHSETFEVVARSFPRFFNWGEVQEEMSLFDFSDFFVLTKEDGSLVLLYHFNGRWRANTRGSFAQDKIQFTDYTWEQLICQALNVATLQELEGRLDPNLTYVCEFCSLYNKIVRRYPQPTLFLLTAFRGLHEVPQSQLDALPFPRPQRHHFTSLEEIQRFLKEQETADPSFEGVVMCDRHGRRWKIKSPTYLGLHRIRGNGDNIYNPKNYLPFILTGEDAELLTYFPEVTTFYQQCKEKVEQAYQEMMTVWQATRQIANQKEFALAILGKTPFTAVLFEARKKQVEPKTIWKDSGELILKKLF